MPSLLNVNVNVGDRRPIAAKSGTSGIDKRSVAGPVAVRARARRARAAAAGG